MSYMSNYGLTDKGIGLHTYTGILFSNQTEWSTDTYYNMDKRKKHYGKWKKPDTNDYILCDSLYMKHPD